MQKLLLGLICVTQLAGCEALVAVAILADQGSRGSPGPGIDGGFEDGYYDSETLNVREGYVEGRIAGVNAAQPADQLSGYGGAGYANVTSEVSQAEGGAFMTVVSIYAVDTASLDLANGVAEPAADWDVSMIGCSGPYGGSWANEASIEDVEWTVEEQVQDDGTVVTQVDYTGYVNTEGYDYDLERGDDSSVITGTFSVVSD